jgi:RNA polymerase sigma factor for flagellar operon FliA
VGWVEEGEEVKRQRKNQQGIISPDMLEQRKIIRAQKRAKREKIWREFSETRDPFLRNVLVLEYMPVVYRIAEGVTEGLPYQVQMEDIISSGIFGLIDAVDAFDISRGVTFETFCTRRIRGAMVDGLRENDWVPRQTRTRLKRMNRTIKKFESEAGRQPTEAELARELALPVLKVHAILREVAEAPVYSLEDSAVGGGEEDGLKNVNTVSDTTLIDPLTAAERHEVIEMIRTHLSERERDVILLYYTEGTTMEKISQRLHVCESRISQIHKSALGKLRRILAPAFACAPSGAH